jgi:hypothetical protein
VEKYSRSQVGGLARHYERAKNSKGEYYKFGNQEIDPNRTHLNYNLAHHLNRDQLGYIKERCDEFGCRKHADVNVMISWVVTAPKDLPDGPDGDMDMFFKECYRFLNDRYGGEDNVVSAFVHMDEGRPHLHYAFIPATDAVYKKEIKLDEDGKEITSPKTGKPVRTEKRTVGEMGIRANAMVNKADMKTFHPDLTAHMTGVFGRDVGVELSSEEKAEREELGVEYVESYKDLKKMTAAESVKLEKAKNMTIAAESQEISARQAHKIALDELKEVQGEVNSLEEQKEALWRNNVLLEHEIEQKKKRIEGLDDVLGLKQEEYDGLEADIVKNSEEYNAVVAELDKKQSELTDLTVETEGKRAEATKIVGDLKKMVESFKEYRNALKGVKEVDETIIGKANKLTGNTTLSSEEMDGVAKAMKEVHLKKIDVLNLKELTNKQAQENASLQRQLAKFKKAADDALTGWDIADKELKKMEKRIAKSRKMEGVINSSPSLKQAYDNQAQLLEEQQQIVVKPRSRGWEPDF